MTMLSPGLERQGIRFGLQTMCQGGRQANVTIIECLPSLSTPSLVGYSNTGTVGRRPPTHTGPLVTDAESSRGGAQRQPVNG